MDLESPTNNNNFFKRNLYVGVTPNEKKTMEDGFLESIVKSMKLDRRKESRSMLNRESSVSSSKGNYFLF